MTKLQVGMYVKKLAQKMHLMAEKFESLPDSEKTLVLMKVMIVCILMALALVAGAIHFHSFFLGIPGFIVGFIGFFCWAFLAAAGGKF